MTSAIELVLFDIGGVLGSNGWDREQRSEVLQHFGVDEQDFQYRHEETVGALEAGQISLDEYLDVTVFCDGRDFSREELNEHRIRQFGLREIFPTFFTSCWLRARKPTHEIYTRVLGMTQADPARTVFIDDRIQNLNPAAAIGIKTIRYESAAQLRASLRAQGLLK